jgi:hypothetical protein
VTLSLLISVFLCYDEKKLFGTTQMTCVGTINRPLHTDVTKLQYSAWIQDPVTKNLRLDLGTPGQTEFVRMFFTSTSGYLYVTPTNDPNFAVCIKIKPTFDDVIGAYVYPYVRYMASGVWQGKNVDMFAGTSPDPVTGTDINNVAMVGDGGAFYGMTALSYTGFIFYDFPTVTLGKPADTWWVLPSECAKAQLETPTILQNFQTSCTSSNPTQAADCTSKNDKINGFSCCYAKGIKASLVTSKCYGQQTNGTNYIDAIFAKTGATDRSINCRAYKVMYTFISLITILFLF